MKAAGTKRKNEQNRKVKKEKDATKKMKEYSEVSVVPFSPLSLFPILCNNVVSQSFAVLLKHLRYFIYGMLEIDDTC